MNWRPFSILVLCTASCTVRAQTVCDSLHTILGSFFEHEGMMFGVVATTPVTLDHISANLFPGTRQYALHMRQGGYVGHTDDPSAWTPLDTVTVTSANTGFQESNTAVVPIPLALTLAPGDTVSFFLTDQTSSGLFSFGNLTPAGSVVESDTHVGITVAYALPRDFGPAYGTYEWSGRVAYCLADEQGIDALTTAGYAVSVSTDAIMVNAPEQPLVSKAPVIELRDLSGRMVHRSALNGPRTHISTVGLAKAPYVLTVSDGTHKQFAQLVVVP
ncbi:MAG: hypothetical protein IPN85_03170 [Flavobacteriales bacterium]|nr:hypothetical protein [Flavobacteriales bacterium]MBK9289177.1 hypothetical protein [Flavobacteriales bacterium]